MAELDMSKSTTTNMSNNVRDFSVNSQSLDAAGESKETVWEFTEAKKNIGYYKSIPELKKAIDILATWTVGKGWETELYGDTILLENLKGWGEDTIQSILWNMIVMKKIVGDSFAEIVRDDEGNLINLKPISPERIRIVTNEQGIIIRYEQINRGKTKNFKPQNILHLSNDRIGDEIHGVSVIDACRWVIDARNEAMRDERMIKHRELAMGVLYIDADDTAKITAVKNAYGDAVKNGEVLVLPDKVARLKDSKVTPQNRMEWIRYLENYFYQAVGVPRIMATSEGFTEAGGKVGFLTFEPIYTAEQTLLEGDMWMQLAIRIKFNRPPSLSGVVQEDEEKNSGQLGFQPKDTTATVSRE